MPIVRWPRAAVAAALGLLAMASPVTSFADPGAPLGDSLRACKEHVTVDKDNWARIEAPENAPADGPNVIAAFAVPAQNERLVWSSNGTSIKNSRDAGCHWDPIHPKPSSGTIPREATDSVITQLVAPTDEGLWVSGYYDRGGVHQPHILWSPNAVAKPGNVPTTDFETADDGLPKVGTPLELVVRSSNTTLKSGVAYLLVEEPPDAVSGDVSTPARRLYRLKLDTTLDQAIGRRTFLWEPVQTLPAGFGRIDGLAMNRLTGTVWIWSGADYAASFDTGMNWKTAKAPGPITTVDVDDQDVAAIYSKAPDGNAMQRVTNALKIIGTLITPIPVMTATHGSRGGVVVISGPAGAYGFDVAARRWIKLTPPGTKGFADVALGLSGGLNRMLVGSTEKALYRLDLFAGESFLRVEGTGKKYVDTNWFPDTNLPGALLTPMSRTVTVRPGERKPAPVKFRVPPSALRLDVYFLVDTTLSMANAIDGLKTGIEDIETEIRRRIRGQACFGLGEVKDFGPGQYGGDSVRPYTRRVPVSCEPGKIRASLDTMQQGGGDVIPEEAQTVGIVQALTGAGSENPPVPGGQSAEFDGNVRVIVTITDAGFKEAPQYPGFPTIPDTIKELDAADTFMVGIAVKTNANFPGAIADLSEVARGSKTFAPPSGVDCDGDGVIDIPKDEALVCVAEQNEPAEIAPAIIGLLLGIPDFGIIEVEANDPHDVIVETNAGRTGNEVTKKIASATDLKFESSLDFEPVVTCSKEQDGEDLRVQFAGRVREATVKVAELVVQCRGDAPPRLPPPLPPPPVPDPLVPVFPVRPVIPAVPIPQFQPPPINNPPPNLNPNAGFSQQEEQQFQLATVQQGAQENEHEETEEELAMVGVAREDAAAANVLLGCAGIMSVVGAGAYAQRRRVQRSLRPAYIRTRRF
jgi:hypothetical protein